MHKSHSYKYKGFAISIETVKNTLGFGARFTVHSDVKGRVENKLLPEEFQRMVDDEYTAPSMAIRSAEQLINRWVDLQLDPT